MLFNDPTRKLYYQIATADGALVAGRAHACAPPAQSRSAHRKLLYDGQSTSEPVRIVEMRVRADGSGALPEALVRVAETKNKRNELAREILLSVVLPQVVLILIAGAMVWVGVVRGLSPLKRCSGDCDAIASRPAPGESRNGARRGQAARR